MANIHKGELAQVGLALDPEVLAKRLPGFGDQMDGIQELRKNYDNKHEYGLGNEYQHEASIPGPVWTALNNLFTPEELMYGGVLKEFLKKWRAYSVAKESRLK